MPSSKKKTLKALYLASSVGDLNKLADPALPVDRNANPSTFIKSADKVYLKAQSHDLDGEEEDAYVFYMRYFNIVSLIKKSSKYIQNRVYYDGLLGKTKLFKSIERAEALQKSLVKRYEKLSMEMEAKTKAEQEAKRKEEEDKKKLESEKAKSKNDVDSDGGFDCDLDSLLNGGGVNSSADVYQKLKVNHSSILVPKTSENIDGALINGLETPSFSARDGRHVPFVSAPDLYSLLKDEIASKVLVIDCRPHSVFLENRINRPSCINIPAELLDLGVSAGSIERRLQEDTRKIWNRRGEKEFVILMDESTKVADITPESRIQRLKDVIFKFDSQSSLKNEPLILDGGFHSWLWHYPSIALKPELPKVMPQPKAVSLVDLSALDYPELPGEKTLSPPETQLPTKPESVPNEGGIQYPILPSTGLQNNHGSLVKPSGGNDLVKLTPERPAHSNMPIPGSTSAVPASGTIPPMSSNPLNEPGPVPKFEEAGVPPSLSQSQNGGPFPRPSDARPLVSSNLPSSQPVVSLSQLSNPQFGASGPQYALGSVSQTIVPNSTSSPAAGSVPNRAAPHPAHEPVLHPGGQGTSIPPVVPATQPSSAQPSSVLSQPLAPASVASLNSPSRQAAQAGIPSPHPPVSQPIAPFHSSSSGPDGSRHPVSSSEPTVSSVPGTQPVHSSVSSPNLPPAISPTSATSVAVSHSSSTAVPQLPSQQSHGVPAPSVPVPMVDQSPRIVQPGHQSQVPPVSQLPPDGRRIPGQSRHSASQPPPNTAVSGAELRSNHQGAQSTPSVSQVPPHQNVSGSTQATQVSPGNSTKQSDRELPQSADQPKPIQQSVSDKQSSYATTPGLPPGWERIDDGGRPYYKDHNTQTTHWEAPKMPSTVSKVSAPRANVPKKEQPQVKRQSSVERPTLHRSLSSPNIAKLVEERSSGPKRPVVDRLSKPDSEQSVPARPMIDRGAKPLSANQLDSFNPSHGGIGAALTGLRNLGNTCYMNSVVQCLSSVAPLAGFFISGAFREYINRSNRDGTRGELAEKFSVLVRVLHSGQFKCVSPSEFKRTVGRFKSQFSGYDQQDSQELLAFLMDGLQEDLNQVKQKPYLKAPPDDLNPEAAANIAWENHRKRNSSIMVELFDGLFMSTVKCMVCGKESRTFDTFSNLTLPLPSHINRCTLEDCLKLFTKPEKMAGDDKWFCPKCRQRREASKTIQIWRLPAILVVHLKRFQYEGMWRQKLQTNVSFPMSQVEMSSFVVGPRPPKRYNLFAVSNHYGTMHGGHYTAFAKNVYDKKWYKFDDQYVTEMSPRDVVTSAGYLLFYTSLEFHPPKLSFKAA